jgi:hypothetical protein
LHPRLAGKIAGTIVTRGYIMIKIDGVKRQAHRLAWLYIHGQWPSHHIDHIDGCPANNTIANLRDVIEAVNHENQRRAKRGSAVGLLGVSRHRSRFRAIIEVRGVRHDLGSFDSSEEAHAAYIREKRLRHVGNTL